MIAYSSISEKNYNTIKKVIKKIKKQTTKLTRDIFFEESGRNKIQKMWGKKSQSNIGTRSRTGADVRGDPVNEEEELEICGSEWPSDVCRSLTKFPDDVWPEYEESTEV